MNPSSPAIQLSAVSLEYRSGPALTEVSGSFQRGVLSAILGPNGGGKSSLLRHIAGRLPDTVTRRRGTLWIAPDLKPHIGWLPQEARWEPGFPITVQDILVAGLQSHSGWFGKISRAGRERGIEALARVGLLAHAACRVDQLSAGQRQRLRLAQLIARDAQLILLDEPFNAVDESFRATLIEMLHAWQQEGRTVLVALHDLALARALFPETLLLANRVLAWGATATVLDLQARNGGPVGMVDLPSLLDATNVKDTAHPTPLRWRIAA